MKYEEKIISSVDGYPLNVRFYDVDSPKGVVQIIHGMQEHQGRYEDFAYFLQSNGYAVVTSDMRGHGPNAPKLSHIADKDGHKLIIEDEKVIFREIKERYQCIPVILLGHSMGTIIARNLLMNESNEYIKVVLSGYPNPNPAGKVGITLSNMIGKSKGRDKYSKMLTNLVLGPFSKSIKDKTSDLDWLSYNKENVKRYEEDPLCGKEFTIGSYNALFHLVAGMSSPKGYKDVNNNLPIYLISGEDDPCTGGEKGRNASIKVLTKAGFTNLKVDTLKHMRHEILNEDDKYTVYRMILEFIDR